MNIPIFDNSPFGPFWSFPLSKKHVRPRSGYVLTKTHCSRDYNIQTHDEFWRHCREGKYITKDAKSGKLKLVQGKPYSSRLVGKSVHLIRNPFDNCVSRFHLKYHDFVRKNQTYKLERYPNDRDGFRSYCEGLDKKFYETENANQLFDGMFDDVRIVPCHSDFFKYLRWHDNAFASTSNLNIPTLVIHYENYTHAFNATKDMLFDFLEQDDVNPPPEFVTGKAYRQYFTKEEIEGVQRMFKTLALNRTYNALQHYFVG